MTSDDHPTLDELAELDEGLLAPEREPAVRAHLATCSECQARAASLAATSQALRALGPISMPADVTARIDAALSAAADNAGSGATASGAAAGSQPAEKPAGDVIPNLADVRQRRRLPSAPASAAAVLVLLAVVAIVIGVDHGSNKPSQAALPSNPATAPLVGGAAVPGPSGASASFTIQSTDRLYNATDLESLVPTLAKGGGTQVPVSPSYSSLVPGVQTTPVPTSSLPSNTIGQGGSSGGNETGTTSGTSRAGSGKVQSKHHRHHKSGRHKPTSVTMGTAGTAPTLPASLKPYQNQQTVLTCARFQTNTTTAVPLAVDLGRWTDAAADKHNVPAIIMLFSDPSDSTKDLVVVVAPPCGDNDLLKYESVTPPS